MTFWILLAVAGFLTVISLRYYNILFSLGASMGWIALWMYNLSNPPTNITVGSTVHEVLIYTFILMAIAVMYLYFRNRNKTSSEREFSGGGGGAGRTTLMGMSTNEYRAYIRNRMRPRRR